MSWFHFKKNYEKLLVKEIGIEEKYNPKISYGKKHRLIHDIIEDKKEDERNYGFKRYQGANPDRIKILNYNLKNVVWERESMLKKGKIRIASAVKKDLKN